MAISSPGTGSPAASPLRVAWSLTHFQGDRYMLENVGAATVYAVKLSADESLLQPEELPSAEQMRPGDNVTFMAARTFGTTDSTITVSWNDESGDPQDWRYPLPPRPSN
jgi:hypothetical protein